MEREEYYGYEFARPPRAYSMSRMGGRGQVAYIPHRSYSTPRGGGPRHGGKVYPLVKVGRPKPVKPNENNATKPPAVPGVANKPSAKSPPDGASAEVPPVPVDDNGTEPNGEQDGQIIPKLRQSALPLPCWICGWNHNIDEACSVKPLPPIFMFPQCEVCQGFHPQGMCSIIKLFPKLEEIMMCFRCQKRHSGFCEKEIFCNTCKGLHMPSQACFHSWKPEPDVPPGSSIDVPMGYQVDSYCVNCHKCHWGHCKKDYHRRYTGNTFLYCNTCKIFHQQDVHPPFCYKCRYQHFGPCSPVPPLWPCKNCETCHFKEQTCPPSYYLQANQCDICKGRSGFAQGKQCDAKHHDLFEYRYNLIINKKKEGQESELIEKIDEISLDSPQGKDEVQDNEEPEGHE